MSAADETSDFADTPQSNRLAAMVEHAFPSLRLGRRRIESSGGDHLLLIVDDNLVFRFPRRGMHDLTLEIAVVQLLQRRCPVATPAYRYIDPAGRFAGYTFIAGSALTPARFDALPPAHKDGVLRTAALFLRKLHSLSAAEIAPNDRWSYTWTPAQYAERALGEYLPIIYRQLPCQARSIESFYTRYRALPTPAPVVVHGDLVAEHILLDEQSGQLAGIIDFGDVALGDRAQDLLGFWAFGGDAARQVAALYGPSEVDPGLLARSHEHFIRYELDRICQRLKGSDLGTGDDAAKIEALLAV